MSPKKCCFTVFCRCAAPKRNFSLMFFKVPIPYSQYPNFLGIQFDDRLCFLQNTLQLKARCLKRLNILRILSSRSWKLSKETLRCIYLSLIQSVIDYSFFTLDLISVTNKTRLQSFQNNCLRSVIKNWSLKSDEISKKSNVPSIEVRAKEFGTRFLTRCLDKENPLITPLVQSYLKEFGGNRPRPYTMPLTNLISQNDQWRR